VTDWSATPITPALGAVVRGVDLSRPLDDEDWARIDELFARYLVLVFPGQELTPDRHVEIGRHFGEPYIHPFLTAVEGHPAILEVLKEPDDDQPFGGEHWHCDISFTDPPSNVSLLYSLEIPEIGGDTLFANTALAYDHLSLQMQRLARGLRAHHTYPGRQEGDTGASAVHPVVWRDPTTGQRSLYANSAFVSRLDGMSRRESAPILAALFDHQTRPEFQCRVSWGPGQLVIWNNHATVHYALNDYPGVRRSLHRVTVLGTSVLSGNRN